MSLWTSDAIAEATDGRPSAGFEAYGVAFDSREIAPGDLFFAMRGEQDDGHRFLDAAFGNGAAGAVVERETPYPHVQVVDSVRALEDLARVAQRRVDATIVGITGSAGKTGTKEALYRAFDRASRGRAHRSLRSYNNHVGVPLSLARMPASSRYGVFELGMNHRGELAALTRLVHPHIAIVTTVAPAHIGYFSGEEEIADAKGEIFEGLESGGVAIVPRDNAHYDRLAAKARRHAAMVISFGMHGDADVRALDAVPASGGGSLVTAQLRNARLCYHVAHDGPHWVVNSLAVLAAVEVAGADLAAAGLALAELEPMPGRGAQHRLKLEKGGIATLIDESYNANPASMAMTLGQLGKMPAQRRIAVLGSMKELGDSSDRYHAALKRSVVDASVDWLVLIGEEMTALKDVMVQDMRCREIRLDHVGAVDDATRLLVGGLAEGDAILVKGSNSVGLANLATALTKGED